MLKNFFLLIVYALTIDIVLACKISHFSEIERKSSIARNTMQGLQDLKYSDTVALEYVKSLLKSKSNEELIRNYPHYFLQGLNIYTNWGKDEDATKSFLNNFRKENDDAYNLRITELLRQIFQDYYYPDMINLDDYEKLSRKIFIFMTENIREENKILEKKRLQLLNSRLEFNISNKKLRCI